MPLPAHPRCLIFDPWADDRRVLRDLLAAQGWLVAGEAVRWSRARSLLQDVNYSLVFLSEKLNGGDAWSLLPFLRHGTRVVVTTRDPVNPLRAFEVNALDYLVKPFVAERLANTLARLTARSTPSARPSVRPKENPASPPTASRVSVRRSPALQLVLPEVPSADRVRSF